MLKINMFLGIVASLLFGGCLFYEKGPLKHEKGIVLEKQYSPDTRQSVSGVGFSTSGSMVVTTHEVGENEKYIVLFKCEHGVVFSINRNDLYFKLNKGDSVLIDYHELLDSDSSVADLDFVDAHQITF